MARRSHQPPGMSEREKDVLRRQRERGSRQELERRHLDDWETLRGAERHMLETVHVWDAGAAAARARSVNEAHQQQLAALAKQRTERDEQTRNDRLRTAARAEQEHQRLINERKPR